MDKPKREHLSPTKIDMYSRCPFQYYCRYEQRLRKPPGAALTFGRSFGEGIDENYRHKAKQRVDLPVKKVEEIFSAEWNKGKSHTLFLPDEKPAKLKDLGIKCIDKFHKEVCSKVQPVPDSVQKKIIISFPNVDYDLLGFQDLEDEKGFTVDNKTANKSWPEDRPQKEIQPMIYTLPQPGKSKFRYDIAVKTTFPQIQQIEMIITPEQKQGILKYIAHIKDAIDSQVFLPRRDHYMCSHRWCGYAELCEKEFGWKIPSDIPKKAQIQPGIEITKKKEPKSITELMAEIPKI